MQVIGPYKLKETDLKDCRMVLLYQNESHNFVDIFKIAFKINNEKKIAPLLASIDPYDNTVFNSTQCEKILTEIEEILKVEEIENIEPIIDLLKSIEMGEYLFLRGD